MLSTSSFLNEKQFNLYLARTLETNKSFSYTQDIKKQGKTINSPPINSSYVTNEKKVISKRGKNTYFFPSDDTFYHIQIK